MPLAAALPYIIGGATVASSVYGANQAKKGVNAQVEAGDRAALMEQQSADKQLALQREIWEKQQADYKPYLEQGTWGINRLGDLMRNQTRVPMSAEALAQVKNKRESGRLTEPVNNANGGQLNNPFDTYLASKGLAGGKFDTSNPAYQFQLKQGQQALDRSAARVEWAIAVHK